MRRQLTLQRWGCVLAGIPQKMESYRSIGDMYVAGSKLDMLGICCCGGTWEKGILCMPS